MIGRIRPTDQVGQGSCVLDATGQDRDEIGVSGCESGCDARPDSGCGFDMMDLGNL